MRSNIFSGAETIVFFFENCIFEKKCCYRVKVYNENALNDYSRKHISLLCFNVSSNKESKKG